MTIYDEECCTSNVCVLDFGEGVAKWVYFISFLLTQIAAWMLRDYADNVRCNIHTVEGACNGKNAVLRISFANFMFFGGHALLLIRSNLIRTDSPRRLVHSGYWVLKLFIWAALFVLAFFIPNGFFFVYGQLARVLSGVYLVVQIIILLDTIYSINEWLLENARFQANWNLVIAFTALFLYVISIVVLGLLYHYYSPHNSCGLNTFFITMTFALMAVYTIISISSWRDQSAGLLTSGFVFAYCTFLCWSALSSEPKGGVCVQGDTISSVPVKAVAFVIAIGTVLISTFLTGSDGNAFSMSFSSRPRAHDTLAYRLDAFHFVFALASTYLAMLLTSWALPDDPFKPAEKTAELSVDQGWFSTWVKIVSQWVCTMLYLWTMLRGKILGEAS